MFNSGTLSQLLETLSSEMRLVHRAKLGNVSAFVELCNPLVRHIYRYIHFLAPNNRVAEALTLHVFFKAWENIHSYQALRGAFTFWLYSIACKQIEEHIRTHKNNIPDNAVDIATRGGEFQQEFQVIREAIRSLPMAQQQTLILKFVVCMPEKDIAHFISKNRKTVRDLQVSGLCALSNRLGWAEEQTFDTAFRNVLDRCLVEISSGASSVEDCLLRHFKEAHQLEPLLKTALLLQLGRDVTPVPSFNSYTHDALVQYLHTRPRPGLIIPVAVVRRAVIALTIVAMASLMTGTAYAQSAMPGQMFYSWKRTSEEVLLVLSSNSVSTNIFLTERRLGEWVSVENDQTLSAAAKIEYQNAIQRLKDFVGEGEELETIVSTLQSQKEELENAGLESPALNDYLLQLSTLLPDHVQPQATPEVVLPIATGTPTIAPTDAAGIECETPDCTNNGNGPGNNNAGGVGNGPGNNNAGGVGNGPGNNNAGGVGSGNSNSNGSGDAGDIDDKDNKENNDDGKDDKGENDNGNEGSNEDKGGGNK